MKYLLDTNVISETGKKFPNAKVMTWLSVHEAEAVVPAMAIAERAQGILALEEPRKTIQLEALKAWVSEFADKILPFDSAAAIQWGQYVQSKELKRQPKGVIDTQIAAIALAHNLILVTRNVSDFPNVEVFNPWD